MSRDRRLREPLGLWSEDNTEDLWYLCMDSFSLYSGSDITWRCHKCVNSRSVRPIFEKEGKKACKPNNLHRATAYQQGNFIVLTGHCGVIRQQIDLRTSFKDFLLKTAKEQWWYCGLSLQDNGQDIIRLP